MNSVIHFFNDMTKVEKEMEAEKNNSLEYSLVFYQLEEYEREIALHKKMMMIALKVYKEAAQQYFLLIKELRKVLTKKSKPYLC